MTSTARDGSLAGPDVELLADVLAAGLPVIAAGGISSIDDLVAVRDLGCEAAVAGSALLAGRFTLPSRRALAADSRSLSRVGAREPRSSPRAESRPTCRADPWPSSQSSPCSSSWRSASGQPRLGMDQPVLQRRHLLVADRVDDLLEVGLLRPLPLGEVQLGATVLDIVLRQPRDRRDVRVPRPLGQVRVAGEAAPARARASAGVFHLISCTVLGFVWSRPYGTNWIATQHDRRRRRGARKSNRIGEAWRTEAGRELHGPRPTHASLRSPGWRSASATTSACTGSRGSSTSR